MSVSAYILIESIPGKSGSIEKEILNIDGVKAAHSVTGPYDVIAVIEKDDLNTLAKVLASEVQAIEGIVRTTTCIAIEME